MRSGELARLAGVTVRALRHYHQVGVLEEPERGSNGYRDYGVLDLVRVLRIRRLASLGIPLERMPELLDDVSDDADGLLDDLDAELARQIDRLSQQRELVARLRSHDVPPDLPPELAPFLAAFTAAGLSPDLATIDRDQSVLLAHLAGEDGLPYLVRLYERLSDAELAPAAIAVAERFDRLGPDSTEQDVTELIDIVEQAFGPVVDEVASWEPSIDFDSSAEIFTEYAEGLLNDRQREVRQRLVALLEGRAAAGRAPGT